MRRKVLFVFFAVFLFVGCIPTKRITQVVTLDLTKYTRKGFFMTEANSINRDYDPIGLVNIYLESGRDVGVTKKDGGDPIYGQDIVIKKGKYIGASLEEALEMMYNEARSKGANAIINLQYRYIPASSKWGGADSAWDVTGMAIKLK